MEMDTGLRAALLDMPAFGLDELPIPPPWSEGRMGDSDQPDMDSQDRRVSTQIVLDGVDKDVHPMEDSAVPANDTPAPAPRRRGRPRILPEEQRRKSQRVEDMPDSERVHMQAVARYLARLRSDTGYSNADIIQRMQAHYPGVALQTLSRLQSPNGITERGDIGYRMIRAVLHALGSSFADMEHAIAASNPAYPTAATEEMQRASEAERALLHNFRRMSALHREVIVQTSRTLARADNGLGMPGPEGAASLASWHDAIEAERSQDEPGWDRRTQQKAE